ncbi:class I SAM-dependent methyltransferase [Mesorhizobium escarrei]|uniref:Methyltransf_11 domain-containing protein n=1 Tax=Mesorhizobium escarrei TaxID=666018 RepID=A0ABN8K7T0_9HYPH|nr:class I SAM-dependent methyltransferase [Mesorhizobium escarrei]CAH2404629.1 Methyltransf_11 domain-containing protein [Mesorhizobium escarrei]
MGQTHEKTEAVSEYLSKLEVHEEWKRAYHTKANERFYELAFDFIAAELVASGSGVLDVGCGPGFHAIRLAKRGFKVLACDFSPPILERARQNVRASGLEGKITIVREDITNLSVAEGSQNNILCWGVLMHIPDLKAAVAELSRVLKPGGTLVVAENNSASIQSLALRTLRKLRKRTPPRRAPEGFEYWQERTSGTLLTREVDISWLVSEFAAAKLVLRRRIAGQFTEAYVKAPRGFDVPIHLFNGLWFRYIRSPGPAGGNVLIFEKPKSTT